MGGGIGMGNTCKSMTNSCQYMTHEFLTVFRNRSFQHNMLGEKVKLGMVQEQKQSPWSIVCKRELVWGEMKYKW